MRIAMGLDRRLAIPIAASHAKVAHDVAVGNSICPANVHCGPAAENGSYHVQRYEKAPKPAPSQNANVSTSAATHTRSDRKTPEPSW